MRLLKNEISIYQGETFTLDFSVVNPNGSPYVLHKDLQNPHLLITISSSSYDQKDSYLLNLWLDLLNYPKFENVIPEEVNLLPEDVSNSIGILYCLTNNGTKQYKYYDSTENIWVDYELRFAINFDTNLTKDLIAKKYLYSVKLVTGERSLELGTDKPALKNIANEEIFIPPTNLYVQSNQNNYGGTQWI